MAERLFFGKRAFFVDLVNGSSFFRGLVHCCIGFGLNGRDGLIEPAIRFGVVNLRRASSHLIFSGCRSSGAEH